MSAADDTPRGSAVRGWRMRRLAAAIMVVSLAMACAQPDRPSPSSGPSASAPVIVAVPSSSGDAFDVTADEAAAISTVVRFIESINAGDIDAATAFLADDVIASDCDYDHRTVSEFTGRPSVVRWLSERIADHERLSIGHIFNENAVFDPVVGVDVANRSNDTLARLGSPDGVVPSAVAKVVLTRDLAHIRVFAFGPGGADPGTISNLCHAA